MIIILITPFDSAFTKMSDGWFEVKKIERNNFNLVGLIKIKNEFPYENQYLKNEFQKDFCLSSDISVVLSRNGNDVFDRTGNYLFSLNFPQNFHISVNQIISLTIFYLAGLIFLFIVIYKLYLFLKSKFLHKGFMLIGFILDIALLRLALYYFKIPHLLYSSELFSPTIFAGSLFFPSLGDLLLNSIVLFFISLCVLQNIRYSLIHRYSKIVKYLFAFLFLSITILLFVALTSIIKSLIINSSISFNLNYITSINSYSVIGFISTGLLTLAFVFFTFKPLRELPLLIGFHKVRWVALLLFVAGVYLVTQFILNQGDTGILFLFVYILSFWIFLKWENANNKLFVPLYLLLLFSFFTTYLLYNTNKENEKEKRKIIAQKLALERDPSMEYLFGIIAGQIESDSLLKEYIDRYPFPNPDDLDRTVSVISRKYFESFSNKYTFLVTICNSSKNLDIQPEDYTIDCYEYFQDKIKEYGEKTASKELYYLNYDYQADYYLGIIDYSISRIPVKIFIEFYTKYIPRGLGYPELLVEKDMQKAPDWTKYSWARYENGVLVYHYGKYFYSMNLSNYGIVSDNYKFINLNGFNHLYFPIDKKNVLLVSEKNLNLLEMAAPFSYIFLFYGFILFSILALIRPPLEFKFSGLSFKKRLQISITSLIIVSFLFIGIGSLFYIISLNNQKNQDFLSEKAHSVLIELEHKLASEVSLSPQIIQSLSDLLYKFSLVFFSDINLYNTNGTLIATSRPEIFQKGLISTKMNPIAYENMHTIKKSLYVQNEAIGEYKYLSAYLPFRNDQNNLIAYINLPYFAKQDELTNEISNFLVAFINIYVILIAIAIFIVLVISNYITKPLQLIKEKISQLKLGTINEKIEWSKTDEIGSLITEYNRMVDELTKSAEMLAKSERESAWREMAKQIAHEIKNPLTPMKLSVQYIQKAWDNKVPDWEEKLKRFTQTISEQIESLSIIASEFSDFANLPKSRLGKTEITEVIINSIELYKHTTDVKITFKSEEKYFVNADKEQLLRVFNNLLKNSIQAITNPEKGKIEISVHQNENSWIVINFSDNGQGIPEELKGKVFYPNFTTKYGGMGLGLAMAKSTIQNAGGEITFESETGKGTTFTIKLPVFEDINDRKP